MAKPISEFVTAFDRLPAALDMDELKAAALDACEVIRADAQRRAPVDTGRLSRAILKRFKADSTKASLEVDIGPDKRAWYGRFAERGTRFHRAQPFLVPAFTTQAPNAAFLLGESIKRIILRVMGQ